MKHSCVLGCSPTLALTHRTPPHPYKFAVAPGVLNCYLSSYVDRYLRTTQIDADSMYIATQIEMRPQIEIIAQMEMCPTLFSK